MVAGRGAVNVVFARVWRRFFLQRELGLGFGGGEAGLVAEVVVVENRIQAVEAVEEGGEELAEGRDVGVAGEVARGFEVDEVGEQVVRGLFGLAGGILGVVFLANGYDAAANLVDEVEEAVGGVGLLEEELGDVAGLAA